MKFSLRALLLFSVIAALVIALWVTLRQSDPMRAENRRLRTQVRELQMQLGEFPEVDPDKIQIMLVDTDHSGWWRMRVHLPDKRRYMIYDAVGHMPTHGLPSSEWFEDGRINFGKGGSSIRSGEFTVDFRAQQRDGKWVLRHEVLDDKHGGASTPIERYREWLDDRRTWYIRTASKSAKAYGYDEPVELLRLQRRPIQEHPGGGYSSRQPEKLADGFVIWIEEFAPDNL